MSAQDSLCLRVLLKAQDGMWVAQALEYDITAQGKNISAAKHAFVKTVVGHILLAIKSDRIPFEGLGKAPRYYWNIFEKAEELSNPICLTSAPIRKLRDRLGSPNLLPDRMLARVA